MKDKKIYSAKQINAFAAKKEEKWLKIDKGLYVVVDLASVFTPGLKFGSTI